MFETDKYDRKLHTEKAAVPTVPYQPASDIEMMSLLFWGEHCVECAAPSCYQSCDLYQPRTDKRCRRFAYGAFKNPRFPSVRGYGVEVSFKKWAKIEAYGSRLLYPVGSVRWRERLLGWGAPIANAIGKLVSKVTSDAKWASATYIALEKLARRIDRSATGVRTPDAFLLEVYNPNTEAVRMQLSFAPSKEEGSEAANLVQLLPAFVTTVDCPGGYSRHEFEASLFRGVTESGSPFKLSLIPEGDNNMRLVFLTADFVKYKKKPVAAKEAKKLKCVVWDLDNTVWKGVLVEGDQVALRPGIEKVLKHLDDRGILLSIASKNDHASAWRKLEELSVSKYFLYPQINWRPKSSNIEAIAKRLNIGIDALAFVDDNPFELEQVATTLPEVACVNTADIETIFSDARFQGSSSADSRRRRQFYMEAIAREDAQEEFEGNYLGFLASCEIALELAPYSEDDLERVAELVQRTNQLNFSGHKYTRAHLNEILADPSLEKYVLRSADKYGTYGTVGFSIVDHGNKTIRVRDFMLSCRVQGKFIEQAFFHHLVAHHNRGQAETLWVNFQETARNMPAKQVLETLGFQKCDATPDGLHTGMVHTSPNSLRCDFIQLRCRTSASESGKPPVELTEITRI